MKSFKSIVPLLVAAGCALLPLLGRAQEAPSAIPTNAVALEALVVEALTRNPELQFYEAEMAAARAGRRTAGLLANPELNAEVGRKIVRGGGFSDDGIAWSVSVMQPLEWPGRLGLRKAIANGDLELAELGKERFKAALTAQVRTLAYGLFAAQERAAAAREVAERFTALREVLVQRDPAGLTPLLETRVIEATELSVRRRATDADLALLSALLELNQLRGAPADSRLKVEQAEPAFQPVDGVDALVQRALTNSFEMRIRAAELAQQGFRVDLAHNERYPSIAVGPAYSEEEVGGERERIIGLSVSLPLPLWNRNTAGIAAAEARQIQAETSYFVAQRELERTVREAALRYQAKLQDIQKWRPDSVQHFKDAAELADRHYRLGVVPVSTYVELQQQYLEAVEGLLDTKKEAIEAAGQLESLAGLPLPLVQTTALAEKELR